MRLTGEGLAAARGGRRVFAGVDFEVEGGAALLVRGPNGAGKSTLLRIIAGFIRPEAGRVRLSGTEGGEIGPLAQFAGHADAVKPALTALENARFWAAFLGGGAPKAALERLGLAGLADIPAGYLSAGQRRRLGLARLALTRRPIWLLDEPTAALDAAGRADLADIMQEHLSRGGLIVAATHGPLGLAHPAELDLESRR
jgi:heme exporter protein A